MLNEKYKDFCIFSLPLSHSLTFRVVSSILWFQTLVLHFKVEICSLNWFDFVWISEMIQTRSKWEEERKKKQCLRVDLALEVWFCFFSFLFSSHFHYVDWTESHKSQNQLFWCVRNGRLGLRLCVYGQLFKYNLHDKVEKIFVFGWLPMGIVGFNDYATSNEAIALRSSTSWSRILLTPSTEDECDRKRWFQIINGFLFFSLIRLLLSWCFRFVKLTCFSFFFMSLYLLC